MRDTRFFSCLGPDREPREWAPPDPVAGQVDTHYFGRALAAMEAHLQVPGLTVYATFDVDALPGHGNDVVVLLIGDEWARVPAYLPQVRLVFRNLCSRPNLGCRPLAQLSAVALSSFLPAARAALRGAPSRLRLLRAKAGAAHQVELPVGTFNLVDLPLKPFAERGSDLFFAGSVSHAPGRAARLKARVMPKDLSRAAMLRSVERLRRRVGLSVDLRLTGSFEESASADAGEYSRALMDSKLALVPRGATTETHRFFQALSYGCVVVTDAVPPMWFYEQAPIVRLNHWDELEDALLPLLERPERLEDLHRRSLRWWQRACSEEAVGRLMAAAVNATA